MQNWLLIYTIDDLFIHELFVSESQCQQRAILLMENGVCNSPVMLHLPQLKATHSVKDRLVSVDRATTVFNPRTGQYDS